MDTILEFFAQHGLIMTIIAILGIIALGVMKYCNLFTKFEEQTRHYIYLCISIGLSLLGTVIYLLIMKAFDITYFCSVAVAIYALNQTFYNIFKVTPINELATKILDKIIELLNKSSK